LCAFELDDYSIPAESEGGIEEGVQLTLCDLLSDRPVDTELIAAILALQDLQSSLDEIINHIFDAENLIPELQNVLFQLINDSTSESNEVKTIAVPMSPETGFENKEEMMDLLNNLELFEDAEFAKDDFGVVSNSPGFTGTLLQQSRKLLTEGASKKDISSVITALNGYLYEDKPEVLINAFNATTLLLLKADYMSPDEIFHLFIQAISPVESAEKFDAIGALSQAFVQALFQEQPNIPAQFMSLFEGIAGFPFCYEVSMEKYRSAEYFGQVARGDERVRPSPEINLGDQQRRLFPGRARLAEKRKADEALEGKK
jgi:hypothetical protein